MHYDLIWRFLSKAVTMSKYKVFISSNMYMSKLRDDNFTDGRSITIKKNLLHSRLKHASISVT